MENRAKKFASKVSGDIRKKLYDAQKPFMVKQEAYHTKELVQIEQQVKQLVQGEPIIHIPYYIIFAKEIYKKRNKFKYQTLINEIRILEKKWETRGLNSSILEKIKAFYVEAYKPIPIPIVCRFDVGRFDVNGFG